MEKSRLTAAAIGAAIAVAIGLVVLPSLKDDSPYSLSLAKINEKGPQRNAVILLSDPQIYTRERLLNDRDLEYAYLKKQLDEIDTKDFTPRLKRDLDQLVEVVGALSANANPLKGAEAKQAAQVTELSNEVQVERLKALLKSIQAENAPAPAPAGEAATPPVKTETNPVAAASLKEVIDGTQALLSALEARIDKQASAGPQATGPTSATPIEELHDKLAYRNELQSAIEQAQLDDRHDLNGNTLYRLQFRATVFPGKVKDKYGIVRMSILPPVFTDDKVGVFKLYLDWLAYVASQLNPLSNGSHSGPDPEQAIVDRYRMFGSATNIYRTLTLPYAVGAIHTIGEIENADEANLQAALYENMRPGAIFAYRPQNELCREAFAGNAYQPTESADATENPDGSFFVPIPPTLSAAPLLVSMIPPCREQLEMFLQLAKRRIVEYQKGGAFDYLKWHKPEPGKCVRLLSRIAAKPDQPTQLFDLNSKAYWDIAERLREVLPRYATPAEAKAASDRYSNVGSNETQVEKEKREELLKIARAPLLLSVSDDELGLALIVARNLHNLAPAYTLAIQRTVTALERRDPADPAIDKLRGYALSVSQTAAAADEFLAELQYALEVPISAKLTQIVARMRETPKKDWFWEKPEEVKPSKDLYQVLDEADTLDDALDTITADSESAVSDEFDRRRAMNGVEEVEPCLSFESIASLTETPDLFYDTVTAARSNSFPYDKKHKPYAGSTYAYSTAPTELAQRVSTVASATQALDLIAAIGGTMPQAGASIQTSGQMRQVASGKTDAIESAPLIVGFSNTGPANMAMDQYGALDSAPSFGWAFGPKVIVDAKNSKLQLSQVLVDQPVTADISIPGWWRTLRLHVETAWAANFEKSVLMGRIEDGTRDGKVQSKEIVTDYKIDVPLHVNPGSFEQLTEYIANKTWGLQYKLPLIVEVKPKAIAACPNQTLLISGPDLWRGRQVFLNGIPAARAEIMPDMQGLAATFDLSKAQLGKASLVVWTQLGQAQSVDKVVIADGHGCTAPIPAPSGGGK